MAARKKAAEEGAPAATAARALTDLPHLGVRCGSYFEADPEIVAALVADGSADAHPSAVAYAKQQQQA